MVYNFGIFSVILVIITLIVFGVLQGLNISTGSFLDWIIGAASFWWLLVIVTVPWNIHFDARQVAAEAEISQEKGIQVDAKKIGYAQKIQKRSLTIAIALHVVSTIGLYALAATGISAVGYISSGAALLLTVLRPAIRTYQYLAQRLASIRQELKYPREDVMELRGRTINIEHLLEQIQEKLKSQAETNKRQWQAQQQELTELNANLRELQAVNQSEHERIAKESKQAIAQLTTDGQFLEHVREIIRFFKTA